MKKTILLSSALLVATAQTGLAQPEARVFSQINIVGNERFSDQDILATANLSTGQLIGQIEIEQAVESLDFTGEFEEISITSQGGTLTIVVDEQPEYTGSLTLGLGYDSDNGVIGTIGLGLLDVLTTGFDIDARANITEEFKDANVQFTYSEFRPDLTLGLRLNYADYAYDDTLYDYSTTEVQPFLTYRVSDKTDVEVRYTYTSDDISNIDPTASTIIQTEDGQADASLIGFAIGSQGRLDGTAIDWTADLHVDTTVSGDLSYSEMGGRAGLRIPLSQSGWALRSTVEAGAIRSKSGDKLPRASDRYSLGAAALRGFERNGVTVRDNAGATVTDLGGNTYATLRNELILPVLSDRSEVDIFVFADIGSVWGLETNAAADGSLENNREWRTSNGIGASYETQLGYFEGYYAITTEGTGTDDGRAFGLTFRADF